MTNRNNNELYHYGVPGMKWGIRKRPLEVVQERAAKKLYSYDQKVTKWTQKKQNVSNSRIRTEFSDAAYAKASRKVDKYQAKADKWYKKVEKKLGSENAISMTTSSGYSIGKKYADRMFDTYV